MIKTRHGRTQVRSTSERRPICNDKKLPRRVRLPAGVEGVEGSDHGQRSRRVHDVIQAGMEEVVVSRHRRRQPIGSCAVQRSTAGGVEVRMDGGLPAAGGRRAAPLAAQFTWPHYKS